MTHLHGSSVRDGDLLRETRGGVGPFALARRDRHDGQLGETGEAVARLLTGDI
jgi:hypothetical protein